MVYRQFPGHTDYNREPWFSAGAICTSVDLWHSLETLGRHGSEGGDRGVGGATGFQRVEAMDIAKHPTMQRTSSMSKNYPAPNVNIDKIEKP